MAITDTGFRKREGELNSPLTRWLVIAKFGISLELQKKSVRRVMMFAWTPTLLWAVIFFLLSLLSKGGGPMMQLLAIAGVLSGLPVEILEKLSSDPAVVQEGIWSGVFSSYMTGPQLFFSILIAGFVGPGLICNDSRGNSFLLYFSRPIFPIEYLLGKFSIVCFFIFSVSLIPSVFLYFLSIAMSQNISVFMNTLPVLGKIIMMGFVMAVPFSLIILFCSSLFKQSRFAMILWFTILFLGAICAMIMRFNEQEILANLVSISDTVDNVGTHLFDVSNSFGEGVQTGPLEKVFENHQTNVLNSIMSLCLICSFTFVFLLRKIKAPLKI